MPPRITGNCYCGRILLTSQEAPQAVVYCHCGDCRRVTGAPVAAFAAFAEAAVQAAPAWPDPISFKPGVKRWSCIDCNSPLAAAFDYLPGQIYIPLGIIDQAHELMPEIHAHEESRLPWLHIADSLPRSNGSARGIIGSTAADGKTAE